MERTPVLPDHAHIPAGTQKLIERLSMCPAPLFRIDKEHIGPFRAAEMKPFELFLHKGTCIPDIICQHLAELIDPQRAFRSVSPDQRMHRQHVHRIIVALCRRTPHAVSEIRIINDMIASDESCQIEGLAGREERDCPTARIRTHHLRRYMPVISQNNVRPDLIVDDDHFISPIDLQGIPDLFLCPYPSAWVMRITEDCDMDVILLYFAVHVLIIHPPYAALILFQRTQHDAVTGALNRAGEADIGR